MYLIHYTTESLVMCPVFLVGCLCRSIHFGTSYIRGQVRARQRRNRGDSPARITTLLKQKLKQRERLYDHRCASCSSKILHRKFTASTDLQTCKNQVTPRNDTSCCPIWHIFIALYPECSTAQSVIITAKTTDNTE